MTKESKESFDARIKALYGNGDPIFPEDLSPEEEADYRKYFGLEDEADWREHLRLGDPVFPEDMEGQESIWYILGPCTLLLLYRKDVPVLSKIH